MSDMITNCDDKAGMKGFMSRAVRQKVNTVVSSFLFFGILDLFNFLFLRRKTNNFQIYYTLYLI